MSAGTFVIVQAALWVALTVLETLRRRNDRPRQRWTVHDGR